MSDHKKGVPVTLDRERYLHFTARDAKTVWALDKEADGLDQLVKVLHIGLRHDDPELTEDQVWDIIDMARIRELNAKVAEAMGNKPEGISDDVTRPLANSETISAN